MATVVLVSGVLSGGSWLVPGAVHAAGSSTSSASGLNSFSSGLGSATTGSDTTTVASSSSSSSGDSVSTGSAILIGVIAAGLLGWIAYYVWHDAKTHNRSRAHHKQRRDAENAKRGGSKPPHKSRKLSPAERKRRQRGRSR